MNQDPLKVLLVEDEFLVYREITAILEKNNCIVLKHPSKKYIASFDEAVEVLNNSSPHLAVLDISIKGEKDGLDLGYYIADNFWTPVMMLTENNTQENARESGLFNAAAFVVKMGKPLNEQQLVSDLNRIKPIAEKLAMRKTTEYMFNMTQILPDEKRNDHQVKKIIRWKDILYLTVEKKFKNNVIFHLADGTRWLLRSTLSGLAETLPPFIAFFSDSRAVNIYHLERYSKSPYIHTVRGEDFVIIGKYKDTAPSLIRFFSNLA